ncbi:MAG: hypothetical protein HY529_00540 [Chloroflexi bacterium]|nr:hypothetical protein [Chloroflexota bacterium]
MANPDKTLPNTNHDGQKKEPLKQSVGKKNLQKIIPIRVSHENWEQIKKEANRMGIGVSTLTRIWIMDDIQKLAKQAIRGKK